MRAIKKAFPTLFLSTTERFDGAKGGIWTSGETGIFDYYGQWTHGFPYYVNDKMFTLLEEVGWHLEFRDAGTVMLYRND